MADYLQPVSDGVRRIAALACLLASLVSGSMTCLVIAGMIERGRLDHNGKPLWIGAAICGLIAAATGWMTVRLWIGRSTNGVTVLPIWFIELFGLLFFIALVWVGIQKGWMLGVSMAVGVAISMLMVRRAIAKHVAKTG